jgi:gliding motility-associated-like protein
MFGKRLGLLFMFLFLTQFVQGQLSNFTLNVTVTNETCTNTGALSFAVSNTTVGATMLYSIYRTSDLVTPISIQSATSISGLSADFYRVVATQSLGNQSGFQQRDAEIEDLTDPLSYQLGSTNEICGNDGTITVNVTDGTAVNYEIFSGPMTRPLQNSNTFTGLTAGIYQIRVYDTCADGVVQTYTLLRSDPRLNPVLTAPHLGSCTMVTIGLGIQPLIAPPVGVVKYPIQVTTTVFPPTGPPIIYNQTITGSGGYSELVPFYENESYTYTISITDGCNAHYTFTGTIENLVLAEAAYTVAPQDCAHKQIAFSNITSLTLDSGPAGYVGPVPHDFTSAINNNYVNVYDLTAGTYVFTFTDICGIEETVTIEIIIDDHAQSPYSIVGDRTCIDGTVKIYEIVEIVMISAPATYTVPLPHDYTDLINSAFYAVFSNLPVGTYVFDVVDRCGNASQVTAVVAPEAIAPTSEVLEGCENEFGSLQITGDLVTISLISAPAAYNAALPVDLTAYITAGAIGDKLTLDSMPPGIYIFESTNECNHPYTTSVTILGYHEHTDVTVTPNCGSFNLNLQHTSNNNALATFWLQKYDPISGNWGHPLTGVVYPDGSVPTNADSIMLDLLTTSYNLGFSGHFRVIKAFTSFSNGNPTATVCVKTIHEFDFSDGPQIDNVFSVSCGATFEVIVNAHGNTALTYRIITRNGQPFLVQNGSSSIFAGLIPALYVFQVEDACHNTVNSQFEVLNPNPMVITATPIPCNGGSISLTVPNFSFLTYQWWRENNPATILSTTNSLNFPSFNGTTDAGTYHVRISYAGNPNSCLNQVLDYIIPLSNTTSPHAGNDNAVSYCGPQGIIDLSTLLAGTFDSTGSWTEITTSGMLTNHSWNSSNVPFGTYQFNYTVSGTCSLVDDALISITIKSIPQVPVATVDPVVCESENLNLFATAVTSATYHWTGPNGFTSTLQNPTLNSISTSQNGIYTVYAEQNGCPSGNSNVTVLVNPLPNFAINQDCVGREYQIWATRLNETSYNEATSTFSWVGPNNFTSNQNPITITGGDLGVYTLTIINEHGCEATNFIDVARTNCFIPNVITPNNDDLNESFDLTGFDVSKLEIYNRWGRKVYEKNNYVNEWHGQNMNGGTLPDSTYYYIVKMGTAEEEFKTGWIFLNRG